MGQVETNPDFALEDDLVEATPADFSALTYILVGVLALLVGGLAGVGVIQLSGGWPRFWPLSVLTGGILASAATYGLRRRNGGKAPVRFWVGIVFTLVLLALVTLGTYGVRVVTNDVGPTTLKDIGIQFGSACFSALVFTLMARSQEQRASELEKANKPGALIADSVVYGLLACIPVATFGFVPRLATVRPFIVIMSAMFLIVMGMAIARIRRAVRANQPTSTAFYAAAGFMAPVFAAVVFAVLNVAGTR